MSEMLYKSEYMNRLIWYIEKNLPGDLDTWLLSNVSYTSHTQLYRDFYSLTGHSVKEYIRKRRLSNALTLIKTSDFPLPDIAYQCGYSSQQAMCRAVKQTLGLTPLEYKNGDVYYFFPPFDGEPIHSVTVSAKIIPQTLCVMFYHTSMKDIENMAVETFLGAVPEYSGRIFGRNGKQDGNRFCYELYLSDIGKDYGKLRECGFKVSREHPRYSATFATSAVQNNERKINTAWDYLYSVWLQNSMFEYTNEPYFEEYIVKNSKAVKLRLYLPIKKRDEETKIMLVSNPGLCFIAAGAKGYDAEKTASATVIDYLTAHCASILKTSKQFYVHRSISFCVCGVEVNTELQIAEDENVVNIVTDDSDYLVLESSVMGDYNRYADLILSFARDNGMKANREEIFAVYDAKESFENPKIKMYCRVKVGTK